MKFKNKKTNEIVEVKGYVQEFAYSHNSEWEKVLEDIKKTGQKPKKKEQ